jgi:DNA invertase Pin-like site-specific DNA recombinase
MLILFDQGTPVAIRRAFPDHIVRTANEQGWSALLNGELLRVAEEAGFEVLLTTDTNLRHQQNLQGRKLAIVIISKVANVSLSCVSRGGGFASLTEALDLTTPAGRAMAGLLAVFAEFEREIPARTCARWSGACSAWA